jgi:hypothetical protein
MPQIPHPDCHLHQLIDINLISITQNSLGNGRKHHSNGEILEILDEIASNPSSVTYTNTARETALHLAVSQTTPNLSLATALLTHHPSAAGVQNGNGNTPLHLLCIRGHDHSTSHDVLIPILRLLLDAHPASISTVSAPRNLHYPPCLAIDLAADNNMSEVFDLLWARSDELVKARFRTKWGIPTLTSPPTPPTITPIPTPLQDIFGNTPLHLALYGRDLKCKILLLLEAQPESVWLRNVNFCLPYDTARKRQAGQGVLLALLRTMKRTDGTAAGGQHREALTRGLPMHINERLEQKRRLTRLSWLARRGALLVARRWKEGEHFQALALVAQFLYCYSGIYDIYAIVLYMLYML